MSLVLNGTALPKQKYSPFVEISCPPSQSYSETTSQVGPTLKDISQKPLATISAEYALRHMSPQQTAARELYNVNFPNSVCQMFSLLASSGGQKTLARYWALAHCYAGATACGNIPEPDSIAFLIANIIELSNSSEAMESLFEIGLLIYHIYTHLRLLGRGVDEARTFKERLLSHAIRNLQNRYKSWLDFRLIQALNCGLLSNRNSKSKTQFKKNQCQVCQQSHETGADLDHHMRIRPLLANFLGTDINSVFHSREKEGVVPLRLSYYLLY